MNNEPCTIDMLEAVVPRYDRWTVKNDGSLGGYYQEGYIGAGDEDIEEYHCNGCGEYFTPETRYSWASLRNAWWQALDHLPSVRTSDGKVVRVEVES